MSSAMTDDALLVQLLLRLKQSQHASSSHLLLPVSWGLRQPRSRTFPSSPCDPLSQSFTKVDSTRCSPSAPLSWTRGLSSSPTSDASDDSTHRSSRRSEDTAANPSAAAINHAIKGSRKRKTTLAELKKEEGLLLDGRVHLGKQPETLHGTFKEHNESFKGMKLNLDLQSSSNISCISAEGEKWRGETSERADRCSIEESSGDDDFLLPDLNMMPCDLF